MAGVVLKVKQNQMQSLLVSMVKVIWIFGFVMFVILYTIRRKLYFNVSSRKTIFCILDFAYLHTKRRFHFVDLSVLKKYKKKEMFFFRKLLFCSNRKSFYSLLSVF
jgi:hypothetical protein